MRQQWKAAERKIAAKLGGQRVPVSGRGRGDVPDVQAGWLVAEIKSYDKNPPSIHNAMAQAKASARPGQLAISVFHRNGDRYSDDIVMLTLGDWLDWFGGAGDVVL